MCRKVIRENSWDQHQVVDEKGKGLKLGYKAISRKASIHSQGVLNLKYFRVVPPWGWGARPL